MKRNIVFVSLLVGVLGGCYCRAPGTGQKVGQIVKISKTGIFCDTWEAQLIRGGFSSGSGTVGTQPFDFTVEREADAQRLMALMERQTEIRLVYRTDGIGSICHSDSGGDYFVSATPLADTAALTR